jgi:hypothetical protein
MATKPMESEQQATSELMSEKTSAIDLRREAATTTAKAAILSTKPAGASTIDGAGAILTGGKDLVTTYFVDST